MSELFLLAIGVVVVVVTLRDVIDTVVVPGSSQGWLQVAERIRSMTLPIWRRASHLHHERERMSRTFAPFVLVATLASWMFLLLAGFGAILYGLADSFTPEIDSYMGGVYVAGLSLATIGPSDISADGYARWGILAAGLAGMFVMTLTVTYILSVQTALHQRDSKVTALATMAEEPLKPIAVLETYGRLNCRGQLTQLFWEWKEWCAATTYSHAAHPALAYFGSVSAGLDWPTALGVILDAAAIHTAFTDEQPYGPAHLLISAGSHLVEVVAERFDLADAKCDAVSDADGAELSRRLAATGYALRRDGNPQETLTALRMHYQPRLIALSEHLGAEVSTPC